MHNNIGFNSNSNSNLSSSSSFNRLQLPPFGRVLAAYQQENIRLDFPIYIFVGKNASEEGFAQKKMGTLCTFLPAGEDFTRYEWPVNNQKVILYDTGGLSMEQLKKMSLILLKFKPNLIYIWSESYPDQFFNVKKEL